MNKKTMLMTTKTITYCAMLAAISVALARLAGLMPNEFTRFSIEAVPIFLAGLFFGPVAGGCVGFAADFVGCMFSPYGYNPIYCIPPILYGVCAGLFRHWISRNASPLRIGAGFVPPVAVGSILIQSCVLAFMQYGSENFTEGLSFFLGTRSVQFAVTMVLDVVIIYVLFRSRIFDRIGIWHSGTEKEERNHCNDSK